MYPPPPPPRATFPFPTLPQPLDTDHTHPFQINWAKATKYFKSDGKISPASFKISISRILSSFTPGPGVNMGTPTAGRKRKAVTASASPAASTTASPAPDTSARKRTKAARAVAPAPAVAAESNNTEGPEDTSQDNHRNDDDQVDEPSVETRVDKTLTEPQLQSEWLGNDDMFGGDSTSDYLQSFMPVS
jgi:hypothetical protein